MNAFAATPPVARALLAVLSCSVLASASPASAQPSQPSPAAPLAPQPPDPAPDARAAARDRFDRGLRLFNEGDNAGALAEFKRAYELVPNTLVLYNIALVSAAMGRPVEAVDALDRVLAQPAGLSPDRQARAKQARDEQAARIGLMAVTTTVPATIEVDGVETAKTPLASPVRVAGGVHVVGAFATGYAPVRREVTVASGEKVEVPLELAPMQGRVAHVAVRTHLPAADVFVDGQRAARTPLAQSLTVAPGPHAIEVRRAGYVTARGELTLGDGANAEVTLEPTEDATALATSGGTLALTLSEPQVNVTVDGQPRGLYGAPLRLAPGEHVVLAERGGFEPVVREVTIEPGRAASVRITFEPTPDYRAAYVSRTSSRRTWGWVSVAAGLAVAGGSVGFLVWNQKQGDDAHAEGLRLYNAQQASQPPCDVAAGQDPRVCDAQIIADNETANAAYNRAWVGYVGIGLGAAATAFGAYLLLWNEDPHRYDPQAAEPSSAKHIVPYGWSTPGGGGFGLGGTF